MSSWVDTEISKWMRSSRAKKKQSIVNRIDVYVNMKNSLQIHSFSDSFLQRAF